MSHIEKGDSAEVIARAAALLRQGKLVAFPTETVYGLGADAQNDDAVRAVFAAKGRPLDHPLIVHVADVAAAKRWSWHFGAQAERLAAAFWPGPLTLIVPRGPAISLLCTGGRDTMAVRVPQHPIALALLREFGGPLVGPSANRYQTLSPTTAAHVAKSLGERVDLILDGGTAAEGIESTVVDVTGSIPKVLRAGALSVAALREHIPNLVIDVQTIGGGESHTSPGQDARHYAPTAKLRLDVPRAELVTARGSKRGLIFCGPQAPNPPLEFSLPADARGYAQSLFATLHILDDLAVPEIWVEQLPSDEAWLAVRDRLQRAASPS